MSPSSTNSAATQSLVSSTLTQALTQASLVITGDPSTGLTLTIPCPNGGSIVATSTLPPLSVQDGQIASPQTMTMRMEFNDCRSQDVVMRGDPYLLNVAEYGTVTGQGPGYSSTMTMKTTGGMRFESGSTQGRAQYDCSRVMTITYQGAGTPVISSTSTGTITWEQPLGTVTTRACGP